MEWQHVNEVQKFHTFSLQLTALSFAVLPLKSAPPLRISWKLMNVHQANN